jgi:hypothetical protein
MRTVLRIGAAGLAVALAGVAGNAYAEEEEVALESETETAAPKKATPCAVSDPCEDIAGGAASMEPEFDVAIEEGPGTKAHRTWVESIWNTP